ncbi:hypothetical protein J4731_23535 [Providencia rettgeri]|nr:hypothetical protein [Providencia rettgeri]
MITYLIKVLFFRAGAVFKTIDLRNNQIEFDSQYIYRTSAHSAGGGRKLYFWAGNFLQWYMTVNRQLIFVKVSDII